MKIQCPLPVPLGTEVKIDIQSIVVSFSSFYSSWFWYKAFLFWLTIIALIAFYQLNSSVNQYGVPAQHTRANMTTNKYG